MFSAQIINVVAPSYLPGLAVFEALVIFGIVAGYAQIYRTYLTAKGDMRALTAMILAQNVALLGVSFG
ncbi:hypothetical protein L6303_06595, partial [archaeon]|nr:hypothetical protein [archaeon]